jgi:hypothetical protein
MGDIAIGFLCVLVNREEMVCNLFEHGGIVIDHATVEADLYWCVRNQQVLLLMAVEVFDPAFLIAITATEITDDGPHWPSPRVHRSTNCGGPGI